MNLFINLSYIFACLKGVIYELFRTINDKSPWTVIRLHYNGVRSSHSHAFYTKASLKNFTKFTDKYWSRSLHQKGFWHKSFPHFFQHNSSLQNTFASVHFQAPFSLCLPADMDSYERLMFYKGISKIDLGLSNKNFKQTVYKHPILSSDKYVTFRAEHLHYKELCKIWRIKVRWI